MRTLHRGLAALLVLTLTIVVAPRAAQSAPPDEAPAIARSATAGAKSGVKTIERVWYRTGKKRGFGGAVLRGDLVLDESALEIRTRTGKRKVRIPLESVGMVSLGKMRGDVDTDWVVLEVAGRKDPLVGVRDGRKFGYGGATGEIHAEILALLRRTGHAQYDVAEGLRVYDELDRLFVLAVPRDWSTLHRSVVELDERTRLGNVLFSERPLAVTPSDRRLVDAGEVAAFFVDRRQAEDGMRCEGFTKDAAARVRQWAGEELLLGAIFGDGSTASVEETTLGGCRGQRWSGRSAGPGGLWFEVRAVSNGRFAVLLGMRGRPSDEGESRQMLDGVARSFRFAVAR